MPEVLQTLPRWPFGHCGAAVVGRDGCPAALEIPMTKTKAKAKPTRNSTMKKPARRAATAGAVNVKQVAPNSPKKMHAKQPTASELPAATAPNASAGSKQSRVLAMLRMINGATIEDIMRATRWQQHSVRGFFAGVVRKKLNLDLASEIIGGTRRYRINGQTTVGGTNKPARAA
jgi:hypothetical protein